MKSVVAWIRRDPLLSAEELSMPTALIAALATWTSPTSVFLGVMLALGFVGQVVNLGVRAAERRWRIDLAARGQSWDQRHWWLWGGHVLVSICLANLFGLILAAFLSQFV